MKVISALFLGVGLVLWPAGPSSLAAQPEEKPAAKETIPPEQLTFFEKSIRPVLVKECYSCHATTAEKVRGGLILDTRDGIRKGGDNGPAVVPGDAQKSRLVKALRHDDEVKPMPPKKKLGDDVIAD